LHYFVGVDETDSFSSFSTSSKILDLQKQGWQRVASKECWTTKEQLAEKPEYCIVDGACVDAFRSGTSGQSLVENKDYFTSRWRLWSHRRGQLHAKNLAYQMLDAKNSAIYSRGLQTVVNKVARTNRKSTSTSSRDLTDTTASAIEGGAAANNNNPFAACQDACWALLIEDLRLECTAQAVERALNLPSPAPHPTIAVPDANTGSSASAISVDVNNKNTDITSPSSVVGNEVGAETVEDYAERRRARLIKEARTHRNAITTCVDAAPSTGVTSPLAGKRTFDPALLDAKLDTEEDLRNLELLGKSRVHGYKDNFFRDSDDSGFDSENDAVVERKTLQRLSASLSQNSSEKWFGYESSSKKNNGERKRTTPAEAYADIYGDAGRGSIISDTLEMRVFGGWEDREKVLKANSKADAQAVSVSNTFLPTAGPHCKQPPNDTTLNHTSIFSSNDIENFSGEGKGIRPTLPEQGSGKNPDYNPIHTKNL